MNRPAAHWRRPLRSGGWEFYFRSTSGDVLHCSAANIDVDHLQAIFQQHTGEALPQPEIRPMRPAHGGRTEGRAAA